MYLYMAPATAEANVITKITAEPIPAAVLVFLDTPRKGHKPKNWLSTTLLTNEDEISMINKSLIIYLFLPSFCCFFCLCVFFFFRCFSCVREILFLRNFNNLQIFFLFFGRFTEKTLAAA